MAVQEILQTTIFHRADADPHTITAARESEPNAEVRPLSIRATRDAEKSICTLWIKDKSVWYIEPVHGETYMLLPLNNRMELK